MTNRCILKPFFFGQIQLEMDFGCWNGRTFPTISYHFMADIHSKSEDRLCSPSSLLDFQHPDPLLLQVFELLGEELPDATSYLGRLMKALKTEKSGQDISSFMGFSQHFETSKLHC